MADAAAPGGQLPPQGGRVHVAARLGVDEAAGVGSGRVPIAHGGGVSRLQPGAGLAEPPGQGSGSARQAEDTAPTDLRGDIGVKRGFQRARDIKPALRETPMCPAVFALTSSLIFFSRTMKYFPSTK